MMPKNRFRRFLDILISPFVYIGLALLALIMVLGDLFMAGRRNEKLRQLKKEGKDEQDKIDAMGNSGDSAGLLADILKRARRK